MVDDEHATATWYANLRARDWTCPPASGRASAFHRRLPGHAPTPLVEVPQLASEMQVGRVFVKDESARLGLAAFKVLGASWAVSSVLAGADEDSSMEDLRRLAGLGSYRLVTATDGNHGRAVAWMARSLGLPAIVLVPSNMSAAAMSTIRREGAEVVVVDGDYDTTVANAAELASSDPDAVLIQDTAWEGYTDIPARIVEGYSTLPTEIDEQLAQAELEADVVVVPAGVGSLAEAVVTHARSRRGPAVLTVEPTSAACIVASLLAQRIVSVATGDTVMAGLNCGTPSLTAWPVLCAGLDAAVAVEDADARRAVDDLGDVGISSGPSGAASLAGARAALAGTHAETRRRSLGVGEESVIVLLSTEGRAAVAGAER